MIISDTTLKSLLDEGSLSITPLGEHAIQPASVDCRLGDRFLFLQEPVPGAITMEDTVRYHEVHQKKLVLPPQTFVLATIQEYVVLPPHITAFVEGRSSIGRLGLFIQNAGWVDPGFEGSITLELYNASPFPIELVTGKRICQLVFCMMDQKAHVPYCGKYQGQKSVVGSRIHQDLDNRGTAHASLS